MTTVKATVVMVAMAVRGDADMPPPPMTAMATMTSMKTMTKMTTVTVGGGRGAYASGGRMPVLHAGDFSSGLVYASGVTTGCPQVSDGGRDIRKERE